MRGTNNFTGFKAKAGKITIDLFQVLNTNDHAKKRGSYSVFGFCSRKLYSHETTYLHFEKLL